MMDKLVKIEILSQSIGIFIAIIFVWYQPIIWGLVFGNLTTAIIKMLLSHRSDIGEGCKFQWEKEAVHEIFNFGKWIFLASILGFFLNQGDRVLLGGLITPELLGVYTIAFFLANALKDILSKLLSSVFFPLLSEVVRNTPDKIESVYYKIRFRIDLVTMPVAGFLFSTGGIIISILYDSRYENAGWMLEVLSIPLVMIGFMLADQLLLSYGKAKYTSFMVLVQVVSLYVFLPISFHYAGLTGAIWVIALNPILKIFITMVMMKRVCFLNIYREVMLLPFFPIGYLVGDQLKRFFLDI